MKRALIILMVAALGFAAFSVVNANRRAARQAQEAAWQAAKAERAAELARADTQKKIAPAPIERTSEQSALPPASPPKTDSMKPATDLNVKTQPAAAATAPSQPAPAPPRPGSKKPPLQDPLARVALSLVGFDPDAEAIWLEAINNPDLPAKEHEDLIEDLNEEGFPDPKNITEEDLPLILSRLDLLEKYWRDDPHFREAYKDLMNMLAKLNR